MLKRKVERPNPPGKTDTSNRSDPATSGAKAKRARQSKPIGIVTPVVAARERKFENRTSVRV
jgi:hypothetical protein